MKPEFHQYFQVQLYSEYERGYVDALTEIHIQSKDCDAEPKEVIDILLKNLLEDFMKKVKGGSYD